MKTTIDQLIINFPYEEPRHYWSYDRESRTFSLKAGRRPAGYVIASESSKAFDDPGIFIEIPAVETPCLLLLKQNGISTNGWRDAEFWWPVLFTPANTRTAVFASKTLN